MATAKLADWEVQKAVRTLLTGDTEVTDRVQGIYDDVPQNEALPYITIGDISSSSFRTHSRFGQMLALEVNIWSDYEGNYEALDIAEEVNRLLGDVTGISVGDHDFIASWFMGSARTVEMDDEDRKLYRIALRYRIGLHDTV